MDEACIVRMPNNGVYDVENPPTLEGCTAQAGQATIAEPHVQIYAADVHLHSDTPLTHFVADWIVPPMPEHSMGQVVYFWPGFKATQPEMGYPVLQPVLQYGEYGSEWELQSWFVDAKQPQYPVVTAPAVKVKPGDKITSYMRQSSTGETWIVSGTDVTTGQNSTLHIKYKKAGNTNYDYAMLVNENINVNKNCALMPASSSVTFTNVTVNHAVPKWTTRADCAGNPKCDCGNNAAVDASGNVILSWKNGN